MNAGPATQIDPTTDALHLKVHSDRWWEEEEKQIGFLWHYGHFILDLVLPLNDWLMESDVDPTRLTLHLRNTPDQSLGTFAPLLTELFGITVEECSEEEFEALPHETLSLKGYVFGPFPEKSCRNILQRIENRFELGDGKGAPKILLIERGSAQLAFEQDDRVPASGKVSGLQRRTIQNHKDVVAFLSRRYGSVFRNVVPEDLEFAEQVKLFYHAEVIIAQHGAGCCNLVWMKRNDGWLLEAGHYSMIRVFEALSHAKGMTYRSISAPEVRGPEDFHPKRPYVLDLARLDELLTEVEEKNDGLREIARSSGKAERRGIAGLFRRGRGRN